VYRAQTGLHYEKIAGETAILSVLFEAPPPPPKKKKEKKGGSRNDDKLGNLFALS
jgi:hypothetical protein